MFKLKHRFFGPTKILLSSVFSLSLLLLLIVPVIGNGPNNVAYAVDLSFAWEANTEPDLAGYRLFYREEGQNYDYNNRAWEGNESTCAIYGLVDKTTYYFVTRAYNVYGDESQDSNEVCYKPEVIEDRDGDGIPDYQDAFPDDPDEWADSDEDGVGDNSDNCLNKANQDQGDSDGDGIGDTCDVDADGDGFEGALGAWDDCDDGNNTIYPEALETSCDGIDQDCNGSDLCNCVDSDADGYGVCPNCGTANDCAYEGNDCNDGNWRVNPGMFESNKKQCSDGLDNDCDGSADTDDFECGGSEGKGKTCSDGIDNDSDGSVDCADPDCLTNRKCR